MGNVRPTVKNCFLPLGHFPMYYRLSIDVIVTLVSILSFPFDGGFLGLVLLL